MPARNTLVQLLALYCTPTLRARMHSVTDRRTNDKIMPIADILCSSVRSAKTVIKDQVDLLSECSENYNTEELDITQEHT